MTTLTLTVPGKPFTANDERRAHWQVTARTRKNTREDARLLALATIPPGTTWTWPVTVTIADQCKTARLRDPGACAPHVKAIIDGITDSRRVWPDDTGTYIAGTNYLRPVKTGRDAIVLSITDAEP